MIPAYNCSQYLLDHTKRLQQDMGIELMQIEVVDDCSMDNNIEELVKKVGKGRVSYFRQKKNVGSLRNFETCINRSRGKYIHLLHGDELKGILFCIKEVLKIPRSLPHLLHGII
jgi:glycosyltransferase involved in cell wall biosynthesis